MQMQAPDPVRVGAIGRPALLHGGEYLTGIADVQIRWIQLVSQTQPNRADRSLIAEPGAQRETQIGFSLEQRQLEPAIRSPDLARVEKQLGSPGISQPGKG